MTAVRKRHRPVPISANGTYIIPQGCNSIGGFLCKTAGAITVNDGNGVKIVDAVAVSAGQWLELPFYIGGNGLGSVVLSGNAVGTLAL